MHNPESVLENKTNQILWDFEIQTDQLIPARQPEQEIVNKKPKKCPTLQNSRLYRFGWSQGKIERNWKER